MHDKNPLAFLEGFAKTLCFKLGMKLCFNCQNFLFKLPPPSLLSVLENPVKKKKKQQKNLKPLYHHIHFIIDMEFLETLHNICCHKYLLV